ncbi:MAG: ABC transporter permease subunit [Candidatus Kapabacteria bacterium]|nr:ABC transporter permease subunit [Candidatus Kapabacteria bacterium]
MLFTLISIELLKIFRKWRTYISIVAIVALVGLLQSVMLLQGNQYGDLMMQGLKTNFMIEGNLINGYLISFIVKGLLYVHIPFLVTLVAGDILAGEATGGTIRMLLTKPITRTQLITAKYATSLIYTALIVLTLALTSYFVSLLLFGTGELMILNSSTVVVLLEHDVPWRFGLTYLFIFLSLATVTTLSFFFSSLVENALGPIISTMAVIIVFTALSFLDVSAVRAIKQYFFTTHMAAWREFFNDPPDWSLITRSASILFGHCVALFGITLYLFRRKDVTT